jgi:hypothetical protein
VVWYHQLKTSQRKYDEFYKIVYEGEKLSEYKKLYLKVNKTLVFGDNSNLGIPAVETPWNETGTSISYTGSLYSGMTYPLVLYLTQDGTGTVGTDLYVELAIVKA